MSLAMTEEERDAFLADLHVGVLSIEQDGRPPLSVPIWYDYEPGGELWVITGLESIKGRSLDSTRRFSLCAQDEAPPYKYVTVEGSVSAIEACTPELHRAMADRNLGEEFGKLYHEANAAILDTQRTFRLTPERWYTVDYAKDLA